MRWTLYDNLFIEALTGELNVDWNSDWDGRAIMNMVMLYVKWKTTNTDQSRMITLKRGLSHHCTFLHFLLFWIEMKCFCREGDVSKWIPRVGTLQRWSVWLSLEGKVGIFFYKASMCLGSNTCLGFKHFKSLLRTFVHNSFRLHIAFKICHYRGNLPQKYFKSKRDRTRCSKTKEY